MKSSVLRTALLGLCLATVAGCASLDERDQREDLHNTLKAEMRSCGTDTNCIRKQQAAQSRSRGTPSTEAKPAPAP